LPEAFPIHRTENDGDWNIYHNSYRTKIPKTLTKTQRKVLKTSNLEYTMLLAQGQICAKNMAFYVPIGCVRFARYCGKMYRCHLFPYGGFPRLRAPLAKQTLATGVGQPFLS